MAEQAPSRLSKSRPREAEDPAPVPRALDHFDAPSKSDINPGDMGEAVGSDEDARSTVLEEVEEVQELEEIQEAGQPKGVVEAEGTKEAGHVAGSVEVEGLKESDEAEEDSPNTAEKSDATPTAGKVNFSEAAEASHAKGISSAPTESPYPDLHDYVGEPGEASANSVTKSLTDSTSHSELDEYPLPLEISAHTEFTLPESVNAERWDLLDDQQSDVELDDAFSAPRSRNLGLSEVPRSDPSLRVSPFAPFLQVGSVQPTPANTTKRSEIEPAAEVHKEAEQRDDKPGLQDSPFASFLSSSVAQRLASSKEVEASRTSGGESDATDNAEGERHEVQVSPESEVANIAKETLAAAAGALFTKVLLDNKDSDNESGIKSASRQMSGLSNGTSKEAQMSAGEGQTFDNGAGVGAGYIPHTPTRRRSEWSVLDDASSEHSTPEPGTEHGGRQVNRDTRPALSLSDESSTEPSTPRFTAEQKGKQVHADSRLGLYHENSETDDLPPINGLSDTKYNSFRQSPPRSALNQAPPLQKDDTRAQIYPPAPPEPWKTEPAANRLSQRRPPTDTARSENTSTLNEDEQNFAFMSSPRKRTPAAPPAPATGVRSLLTDYPDVPPRPASVTTQPVITLPADPSKAPVLQGRYELPSIEKIDQWKSKNGLAPNAFRRLLFNFGALVLSNIVMKGRFYRSIVRFLSSFLSPSIFFWAEWGIVLLFLFNIAEVLYSYTKSSNNFEYLPLTPSQRTLLGLDPVVTKVPGAVPVFKKSVSMKPRSLTEKPIMSTYVSPSQGSFTSSRAPFQKPVVGLAASEYRDAATILNMSMSRSFNQASVQDKADLDRLMRNVEARDELQTEWKGMDVDGTKRPFGFGAPQGGLATGVDMAADNAGRPDLLASLSSRGAINRYQPALRTTLSKDHTSKADLQKDGLYVVGHSKVLKNLKISEQQLDRWVFNMRKWMWNSILKHVCIEMEVVDAELAKQGLSYLDCKSATMFYTSVPVPQGSANGAAATAASAAAGPVAAAPLTNSLGWGAASIATSRLGNAFAQTQPQEPQLPTSLQDLGARYGHSPIVKQRLVLETYLAIPGYANRKYVIERLKAIGPLLTHFIWDSNGVTWDGGKKTWTPDLPTDAQIIMHMFTVFMDLAMPAQDPQIHNRFPFSYKYYVPMESKPDATTALQIKQSSKVPPNYSLVVEGSMWEVVPKRLNVWYTLVLFIYMVMKENGGYIGQLNIGTQAIGLGDVVEGYDL